MRVNRLIHLEVATIIYDDKRMFDINISEEDISFCRRGTIWKAGFGYDDSAASLGLPLHSIRNIDMTLYGRPLQKHNDMYYGGLDKFEGGIEGPCRRFKEPHQHHGPPASQ